MCYMKVGVHRPPNEMDADRSWAVRDLIEANVPLIPAVDRSELA